MAIPGLPGGVIIYQGHLFPLKGHLCIRPVAEEKMLSIFPCCCFFRESISLLDIFFQPFLASFLRFSFGFCSCLVGGGAENNVLCHHTKACEVLFNWNHWDDSKPL